MNFSIAIPSFNRPEELIKQIDSISAVNLRNLQEIVIINNGYSDQSVEQIISNFSPRYKLRVVNALDQSGFHYAFLSLVDSIRSDYFLYMTDDDYLYPSFMQYIDELEMPNNVCILSSQWVGSNGFHIRKNNVGKYPRYASDILAGTAHAPGLLFHTHSAQLALPKLHRLIQYNFDVAKVYPQVFLSVYMYNNASRMSLTSRIGGHDCKSNQTQINVSGQPYFNVTSRFIQLASLHTMLLNAQEYQLPTQFLLDFYGRLLGKVLMEIPPPIISTAFFTAIKKLLSIISTYFRFSIKRLIYFFRFS